jgi:hypothetical protein
MNCLRGCMTTGSCVADSTFPTMNYDVVKAALLNASVVNYSCTGSGGLSTGALIAIIVCSVLVGIGLIGGGVWYYRKSHSAAVVDVSHTGEGHKFLPPSSTVVEMGSSSHPQP